MILIRLKEEIDGKEQFVNNFEYDVQSLARAFYVGVELKVNQDISDEVDLLIEVEYLQDIIGINIYDDKYNGRLQLREHEYIQVQYEDRTDTKNRLKRLLYIMLRDYTGKELPWGTLTGIRPIKLLMSMLEKGRSDKEISASMKDTYLISDEKLELCLEIAKREAKILETFDYKQGYSVYIGIPFCPSTCAYCSFTSYPISKYKDKVDEYIDALCKEIDYVGNAFRNRPLHTVYIGGGTPTTLSPQQLERLIGTVKKTFDFSNVVEFSVEAGRPDSITEEKLLVLKKYGVTRISINPQTFKEETLKLIGRKHTIKQLEDAYALAKDIGFSNINMDFIVGLPEEGYKDVENTMERAYALQPDSITIHSLAIKRAARLNVFKEQYENCHFDNDTRIVDVVAESANSMGFKPYYLYRQKNMTNNLENVGYSLPGKEGIYNILIMEEKQTIVAVGAGAISKFVFPDDKGVGKVDNVKDVQLYIDRIDEMIGRKANFINDNAEYFNNVIDLEEEIPRSIAHGICVSNLAYAVAKEYGLLDEKCYDLAVAGILHDIGKLKLFNYFNAGNKAILKIEKMKYIRMHSQLSYDILKRMGYSECVCESVLHHHENYDGSGFPNNLAGKNIPIGARILRICDVFIALISKRSYRDAFDVNTAFTLMIEEVKNFDIKVFNAFQNVIHEIDFNKIEIIEEDIIT